MAKNYEDVLRLVLHHARFADDSKEDDFFDAMDDAGLRLETIVDDRLAALRRGLETPLFPHVTELHKSTWPFAVQAVHRWWTILPRTVPVSRAFASRIDRQRRLFYKKSMALVDTVMMSFRVVEAVFLGGPTSDSPYYREMIVHTIRMIQMSKRPAEDLSREILRSLDRPGPHSRILPILA